MYSGHHEVQRSGGIQRSVHASVMFFEDIFWQLTLNHCYTLIKAMCDIPILDGHVVPYVNFLPGGLIIESVDNNCSIHCVGCHQNPSAKHEFAVP
ncbi:hypothetical protein AVEN_36514-1 [Araneus ventricosus]|uniref:Uncharacterized protein n=1 Tax=Araneus ventricosus TaxID=182803 RepID=A0A4Y2H3T8_ARAVE|nr:hypothetical protein AVEN_36514-1 [Araneus ventricosus]